MSDTRPSKFHSVIARRLTIQMIALYIVVFIAFLSLMFAFLIPQMNRLSNAKFQDTILMMENELETFQSRAIDYANMLSYSNSLHESLSAYENDPSEKNKALVELALSTYSACSSAILAVTIEDYDHNYFTATNFKAVVSNGSALKDNRYFDLFNYTNGSYLQFYPETFNHTDNTGNITERKAILYTKIMSLPNRPYVVRIFIDVNQMFSSFDLMASGLFTDYALLYADFNPMFFTGPHFSNISDQLGTLFSYERITNCFQMNNGYYYYYKIPSSGWIVLAYTPNYIYYQNIIIILSLTLVLFFCFAILFALLLFHTATKFLSPINKLNACMAAYSAGDTVEPDIHTNDEMEQLSNIFVSMTQKLNRQVENIQEQEHINAVVSYKLLATQIDPHFIYNTMNIINIMARQGNTAAIIEINSALIKILQERLNSKLSISDTIEAELDSLYKYLLIMDYRYGSKVHLDVNVEENLKKNMIPKNIIQPLVENCFLHAFAKMPETEECNIDITIYSIDAEIVIEISDNGVGIEEDRLSQLINHSYHIYDDKKPHIGLDNIQQRLKYIYGDKHQFEIYSTPGYGTTISITIPAQK